MASVIFAEQIEIPFEAQTLAEFRRWVASDEFPEKGRIDFIDNSIEVQMSPEEYYTHGCVKAEIQGVLYALVKKLKLGNLQSDRTRISSPLADLSVEPDVVFISYESLDTGRARLIPMANAEEGRYIEVEGSPDLVVEVVSNSSVAKDTKRLPIAYFKAGISEYWIVDARGKKLVFQILTRGPRAYRKATPDAAGYQRSTVFGKRFRLDRKRDRHGWQFDLLMKS